MLKWKPDQPEPPKRLNQEVKMIFAKTESSFLPERKIKHYRLNNAEFKEEEHPRDSDGKFTETGGSGDTKGDTKRKSFTNYSEMLEYQKKEWLGKLSSDEVKAVNGFTRGNYRYMRAYQAGDKNKLEKFPEKTRQSVEKEEADFQKALDADGKFEGTVYRGMNFSTKENLNAFLKSKVITMNADSSGTIDRSIASNFASQGQFELVMEIKSKTAVSIENLSSFRQEKELILRKGTKYAVKKKKTAKGVTVVQLEEL